MGPLAPLVIFHEVTEMAAETAGEQILIEHLQ
jgi:hypothetical protein